VAIACPKCGAQFDASLSRLSPSPMTISTMAGSGESPMPFGSAGAPMSAQLICSDVIAKTEQMVSKQDLRILIVNGRNAPQAQSGRREFLFQALGMAFAGSAVCCGCQSKGPSETDRRSPADAPKPLVADDRGSGNAQGSAESIERRIIEIVAEQMRIPRERIERESRFKEDLGADSLDTVELVMEFEEEFDINIPDDVAVKTLTVGQAVECVTQLVGNCPMPPRKSKRRPGKLKSGMGDSRSSRQ
jgi:acyl carrier protein